MSVFANLFFLYILMNMIVVRQRLGKHVPEAKNRQAIIYFLGKGSASTFPWQKEKQNKRAVRGGDLRVYSGRLEVVKELVQFIRKGIQ
jgi:hypothetical protein